MASIEQKLLACDLDGARALFDKSPNYRGAVITAASLGLCDMIVSMYKYRNNSLNLDERNELGNHALHLCIALPGFNHLLELYDTCPLNHALQTPAYYAENADQLAMVLAKFPMIHNRLYDIIPEDQTKWHPRRVRTTYVQPPEQILHVCAQDRLGMTLLHWFADNPELLAVILTYKPVLLADMAGFYPINLACRNYASFVMLLQYVKVADGSWTWTAGLQAYCAKTPTYTSETILCLPSGHKYIDLSCIVLHDILTDKTPESSKLHGNWLRLWKLSMNVNLRREFVRYLIGHDERTTGTWTNLLGKPDEEYVERSADHTEQILALMHVMMDPAF